MKFSVLYGTESGNSEFIAQDLVDYLTSELYEAELGDLANTDPTNVDPDVHAYLIICSTHGEGELPHTAIPFLAELEAKAPDLSGVRYAMFGLGDSFYAETYSQGSEIIDRKLTELGATRIGEYGRHDASSIDDGTELALAWVPGVLADLKAQLV
ncbi:MAG: flavodoxin domain-containing protein [Actinobacteria bacterium]|jgi:MioC protein|nr:flavodoxin domain-containing protein [Actinomycetota bacterium]